MLVRKEAIPLAILQQSELVRKGQNTATNTAHVSPMTATAKACPCILEKACPGISSKTKVGIFKISEGASNHEKADSDSGGTAAILGMNRSIDAQGPGADPPGNNSATA